MSSKEKVPLSHGLHSTLLLQLPNGSTLSKRLSAAWSWRTQPDMPLATAHAPVTGAAPPTIGSTVNGF